MSSQYTTFRTIVELTLPGGAIQAEATVTLRRDREDWLWWTESVVVLGADITEHLPESILDTLADMAGSMQAA